MGCEGRFFNRYLINQHAAHLDVREGGLRCVGLRGVAERAGNVSWPSGYGAASSEAGVVSGKHLMVYSGIQEPASRFEVPGLIIAGCCLRTWKLQQSPASP